MRCRLELAGELERLIDIAVPPNRGDMVQIGTDTYTVTERVLVLLDNGQDPEWLVRTSRKGK